MKTIIPFSARLRPLQRLVDIIPYFAVRIILTSFRFSLRPKIGSFIPSFIANDLTGGGERSVLRVLHVHVDLSAVLSHHLVTQTSSH